MDVDVQQSVSIHVHVLMRDGSTLRLQSPTLLPELSSVVSITACSEDYFGATIEFLSPDEKCARCDSKGAKMQHDTFTSTAAAASVCLRAASSLLRGETHSVDVNRLQRCSRCPNAAVMHVKKRDSGGDTRERTRDIFSQAGESKTSAIGEWLASCGCILYVPLSD
jgi:hypothetical protein